jgi:3-hydroxybutyrate dehydrogenase
MKKERVAIITVAARGIGLAIALSHARDGFNIVASDIREDELRNVADEIKKIGHEAICVPADVTH